MQLANNILQYWYNLEFFSPFWPKSRRYYKVRDMNLERIPWITTEDSKEYTLYIGKVTTEQLMTKLLEVINAKDSRPERDKTASCVCALKVDHTGRYIEGTFGLSSFVWAFAQLIDNKNLSEKIVGEAFEQFQQDMDQRLAKGDFTFDLGILQGLLREMFSLLQLDFLNNDPEPITIRYTEKEVSVASEDDEDTDAQETEEEREEEDPLDEFEEELEEEEEEEEENGKTEETEPKEKPIEMLPSFYAKDIKNIKENLNQSNKIFHYIKSLCENKARSRIEIDTNIQKLKQWTLPAKYPLGKWPSKFNPSLMQQVAINISINEEEDLDFFSVNGPPGTGKTTLLKEIIASNVVERAKILCEFDKPNDLFTRNTFEFPPNPYRQNFYEPDARIVKYGMIVASNNNAAVENISIDLPKAEDAKKGNTSFFDVERNPEVYFSDLATELLGTEGWGLISARGGRKSNLAALTKLLTHSHDKEQVTLYSKINSSPNLEEWQTAKNSFLVKYNKVVDYQNYLQGIAEQAQQYEEVQYKILHFTARIKTLEQATILAKENLERANQTTAEQKALEESLRADVALLESHVSTFRQILSSIFPGFFEADTIIKQLNSTQSQLTAVTLALVQANENQRAAEQDYTRSLQIYNLEKDSFQQLSIEEARLKNKLEIYKNQLGKHYPDNKFWSNISQNEPSQLISPWTNKEFDTLREELFYEALQLHKAFIINSNYLRTNLGTLEALWNGEFKEEDRKRAYAALFNTLQIVIPVISTTFAAAARFLGQVPSDSLGTLIVDEAGQATPHSALGAFWRAQKAIVVGDPLQVEPVMTVSKELLMRLGKELALPLEYQFPELSVQVLADNLNRYGGLRTLGEGELWLGCPLVVHRRCQDPMFSISNNIAYNGRMFKQSGTPDEELISKWLDVKGAELGNKNRYVPRQGEVVVDLVEGFLGDTEKAPSLYIISPFTSVVDGIKERLKEHFSVAGNSNANRAMLTEWIDKSIGTVHTFQGKEADRVIFLLGCDEQQGLGAARWASSKPNILNVAVTRAKKELYIVGDAKLWGAMPYFDTALELLCRDN